MNKRIKLILFLIAFYGVAIGIYWFKLGFDNIFLRETVYLATALLAFLAGLFALKKFGVTNNRTMVPLFLTAGVGYWFLGELLFNYNQYILHVDPYPSIADIFYILGYPLLLIGLLSEIGTTSIAWKKLDKSIFILLIPVVLLFAMLVIYFGIYQAYDVTQPFFTNAVAISYGIGDLLLMLATILLLLLAWEFRGGRLSHVWIALFLSFVCMLVADILFAVYAYQYELQEWFYKSLLDSFWMAAYLFFAYAFFEFGFSIQDVYVRVMKQVEIKTKAGAV